MFVTFISNLFNLFYNLANMFSTPINSYIINNFPDFASQVSQFNTFINTYIGNTLGWFSYLIPPTCKTIILFYLSYLLIRFIAVLFVHSVLWVIQLLKNLKIW